MFVQSQQQKHQNSVWNLLKFNNKDTVIGFVLVSLLLPLNRFQTLLWFHTFQTIVDFEQVSRFWSSSHRVRFCASTCLSFTRWKYLALVLAGNRPKASSSFHQTIRDIIFRSIVIIIKILGTTSITAFRDYLWQTFSDIKSIISKFWATLELSTVFFKNDQIIKSSKFSGYFVLLVLCFITSVQNVCHLIGREKYNIDHVKYYQCWLSWSQYCTLPQKNKQTSISWSKKIGIYIYNIN